MPDFAQVLQKSSSEGVSIIPFVHDLIPMVMPQHVTDATRIAYRQWIRRMADLTHTFLANSKATAADLAQHLAAIAPDRSYNITLVPLAHEFVERPFSSEQSVRASVLSAARLPYVLMVGTLEVTEEHLGSGQCMEADRRQTGLERPSPDLCWAAWLAQRRLL